MSAGVVLMLLLVINAIIRALRRTGQLTGEPDHDRRRVLALLGSLPLAQFVRPVPVPPRIGAKLCNIRKRVHQPFRDALIRSPVLAAQVDRLVEVSFDGLFPRDVQ